jgi:hypothetical protein
MRCAVYALGFFSSISSYSFTRELVCALDHCAADATEMKESKLATAVQPV